MSVEELKMKLREALATIKEKERDLLIAAEIGQELVTANTSLVSEYESLLTRSALTANPLTAPATPERRSSATTPTTEPIDIASSSRAPSSPPASEQALRASKRASMSLTMSRLATAEAGGTVTPLPDVTEVGEGAEGADGEGPPVAEGEGDPAAATATAPGPQAGASRRSKRRTNSINMYEYVASLERSNADMKEQLNVAIQNLQDAEKVHHRSLTSLRRTNTTLQSQLQAALEDLRDAERHHGRSVSQLESDLDALRSELSSASLAAQELEQQRRRLMLEKKEAMRESASVELSDTKAIQDLGKRLRETEAELATQRGGRKEAERRCRQLRDEMDAVRARLAEAEEAAGHAEAAREECERRGRVIEEMKEQIEVLREGFERVKEEGAFEEASGAVVSAAERKKRWDAVGDQLALVLAERREESWEWGTWITRVRSKTWERDVEGLRQEIGDLQAHRVEAYTRLQKEIETMMSSIVSVLPQSLQSLTTRVVGIPSSPPTAKLPPPTPTA
ncbi:hypothetical protein HK101_005837 [Irineochytrium annulatum]|nr:hypothetical protein HK101_005837 [Irineochytrium annulatum]